MTVHIRAATGADADAIAELLGQLYGQAPNHSLPIVRQESTTLTAEVDGRVVGLIVVTSVDYGVEAYAAIEELVIAPEYQAMGLGSKLLTSARAWSDEHGCDVMFVSALDADAAGFYRHHGFTDCTGPWLYAQTEANKATAVQSDPARRCPPGT